MTRKSCKKFYDSFGCKISICMSHKQLNGAAKVVNEEVKALNRYESQFKMDMECRLQNSIIFSDDTFKPM